MSEHASTAPALPDAHTAHAIAPATPEFDRAEIQSFGADDGHAVTVIGKMLVGFFFYSLLVMGAVAWLTWRHVGQPSPHAASAHHAAADEEF